jgi:cystathionine beta-lyase/cystathionine gamma-synthase
VLSGSAAMMKKIFDSEYLCVGSGIQPFNAWLLLRGLRTLPMRLERISATTREVLAFLKHHPSVEEVIFPLEKSYPQYELARKQMKGASGLISFYMKADTISEIEGFCERLKHFRMAVSWGGHESLIIPKCSSVDPADFDPQNRAHRLLRIYVGLEDADYLIRDLSQAFQPDNG